MAATGPAAVTTSALGSRGLGQWGKGHEPASEGAVINLEVNPERSVVLLSRRDTSTLGSVCLPRRLLAAEEMAIKLLVHLAIGCDQSEPQKPGATHSSLRPYLWAVNFRSSRTVAAMSMTA